MVGCKPVLILLSDCNEKGVKDDGIADGARVTLTGNQQGDTEPDADNRSRPASDRHRPTPDHGAGAGTARQ
ncbi:hypothetical protein Dda3937_04364 [Dickeya dadantii 3937]|uniref:Uncharacterized protein n=1 Tax=Dickeya dadantii (strain 3937) TaxID=198628 RepID=E0SLF2_DICD3|nr:hypothetical protein Dda3937_04364 [Dickeya dadantii 3937]